MTTTDVWSVLERIREVMREGRVFLGGPAALLVKYSYGPVHVIDLYSWDTTFEDFLTGALKHLQGLNAITTESSLIVENEEHVSVLLRYHVRDEAVKRLRFCYLYGIPLLSDPDTLGELLFDPTCSREEVIAIEFLLRKVKKPLEVLQKKFDEPPEIILQRLKERCPDIYKLL